MENKTVRWGIWGTGGICNVFSMGMEYTANGSLHAVLSRDEDRAMHFADEFAIPRYYSDTGDFLADTDIDVVYVGTPSGNHYEHVMRCLAAGKHVLCEKPLASNEKEAAAMLAEAEQRGLFLMEAIWTHFFPAILKAREWLDNGLIGRPLRLQAGFCVAVDSGGWRMQPGPGNGALLDVGIYCLTVCSFAFGLEPKEMKSMAVVRDGLDIAQNILMRFGDDQIANMSGGFDGVDDHRAVIIGEKGYLKICAPFWRPSRVEMYSNDPADPRETKLEVAFDAPYESTGMQFQAEHAGECILEGKTESEVIPHEKSLQLIRIMDSLRREWGIEIDTI